MPRLTPYDRDAVDEAIARQDRLITYEQLVAAGFPRSTVTYRARLGGPWQRMLPGTYLTHRGTPTRQQQARAALLYAGDDAVLTGPEALRRYGLLAVPPTQLVHLLIPMNARRRSNRFAVVERTERIPDPVTRADLPCAPVPRALVDAAHISVVRAILVEGVQTRRCTVADLAAEVRDGQMRQSARARDVVREMADGIRSAEEARCRQIFRLHGVPPARWNPEIRTADGKLLGYPDALWDEWGVVLEVDSMAYHLDPLSYRRTVDRHMQLSAHGLLVLHVTPARLREDPAAFAADVKQVLLRARMRRMPGDLVVRDAA